MSTQSKEPIVIIGSGCRFPGGSSSPSKLWNLLQEPRDLLCEIPTDRFSAKGFYHRDGLHHGSSNVQHAYLLSEDHRHFDARFFGIKAVEANAIDPQQRLLLETVYEGVEAAGLRMENMRDSDTAVYVGLMCGDYEAMLLRDLDTFPTYHATGIARSIMANRISYFFDWHGPSLTIDTACSSSLVAVHQAVQVLRSGESRVAVAAGSNLILGPEIFIAESKLKMLSPTGRSRMWDKDADGYARGEGVAAVVLKTLSAALEDGDHIECLIRETGVNQDGRTKGITMPSATAQASLIRDTYVRAGLNPQKTSDRCQYFEAHGTGTPTGDPLEAEAVNSAFFANNGQSEVSDNDVLYVGSIKTVIGHTEGTAGLAALLKASLALQHAVIPPNMLFNQLNPSIKQFYGNLQVLAGSQPWPLMPTGQPRRASVNSFGFGGTNAHAILESYEPIELRKIEASAPVFTPFTFSANSETSLIAQLKAHSNYLLEYPSTNIRDLAFSLNERRSLLPLKAAFAAQTTEALGSQIEEALSILEKNAEAKIGIKSGKTEMPAFLGIFTGQGAQYARMGADILANSDSARRCIDKLEQSLNNLPPSDRPQWSLKGELFAKTSSSRVTEAALSQPLCTAIQIMLVDILHEAGVRFKTVVGHSSGEIAAAYAAGFISAHDAIRIAYYRGFHSHLAIGKDGRKGAMIAVATSMEDAQELCELPDFEGKITVAAINSAASVTISGDEDAIAEAKTIFNDEKKKATILKVDKAYHSRHMVQCSDAYLRSLQTCGIESKNRQDASCSWYSSVYNQEITGALPGLKGSYWNENLVRPVLFAQALTTALEQTPSLDAVIEVGPHPALKGPAIQTIQDVLSREIPYTGLLNRGKNSINALANCIGYLWTHIGEHAVDIARYREFMASGIQSKHVKDLPTYQWDHDQVYWQESRVSRALRTRDPVHELLGSKCPDGTEIQMSWRNLLRTKEVPWIQGHALQGQTIFPAAGYVATAIEASKHLATSQNAKVLEIQNLIIHQPMVFNDDDLGIETLFSFCNIVSETDGTISALFTYHSAVGNDSNSMTLMASGRLQLLIGAPSSMELPVRALAEPNMIDVEDDRFYASLAEMGYGYTGPFRALSSLKRKLGKATGLVSNPKADGLTDPLMMHPAMLDAAIQSVILAYCYPGDGQLWSLHLPTSIDRIIINLHLCASIAGEGGLLPFDSAISENLRSGIYGDVHIYAAHSKHAILQVEGMRAVPFTGATSANDSNIFSSTRWSLASLSGEAAVGSNRASPEEYELAYTLERVASFYLRSLDQEIPRNHPARKDSPYVGLFNYATHVCSLVSDGRHPYAKKEWTTDTLDFILSTSEVFLESPDLKIMHIVGREMPRVIYGETTILEHILPNNLLENYYTNALGFPQFNTWLSRMIVQLSHRYPRMKILEIGAGTGGATKRIFKHIDSWFSSYTFTDISNGFFKNAQETFKDHADKMTFKVLDLEKDIMAQGFDEQYYDLVIASLVLHATAKLEQTMRNVRRLLKPGGHIIMAEVTNNDQIRSGFIFGALPGWWLGADDGRVLSPCVSPTQWDIILRKTGFSGVDTITPDLDRFPYLCSVIASQAVDPQINFLRSPLSAPYPQDLGRQPAGTLLVIGGITLKTMVLVEELSEILLASFPQIDRIGSIAEITPQHLSSAITILSLAELDEPVFKDLTPEGFQGMKNIFSQECTIMWITRGRRADIPESNMTYGFARSQLWEVPDLRLQFIDLESPLSLGANMIAESLIRFSKLVSWERAGRLENVLWSLEPELVLKDDQILIPRLAHMKEANDRLNSSKRPIFKQLSARDSNICLIKHEGLQTLEERKLPASLSTRNTDYVDTEVEYSLMSSIKTLAGRHYVAAGKTTIEHLPVLTISDSQASIIRIPKTQVIPCPSGNYDKSQLLLLFAHHLIAEYLLSKVYPGDTVLVHEPGMLMFYILSRSALEKGIRIDFTSSGPKDKSSATFIHPCATKHDIRKLIPSNTSLFIDLSTDRRAMALGTRITSLLPLSCKVKHDRTLFTNELRPVPPTHTENVRELLKGACLKALQEVGLANLRPHVDLIDIAEIYRKEQIQGPFSLIDWTASSDVSVNIQPVDSKCLFAKDRTYWLVGLTGGLGLSLCEWMIQHGAKHVVLSSRNPKVDERWRKKMEAIGAFIKICSSDVTDRDSVRKLYQEICDTLPRVAGIAQGAMKMQDMPTRDMNFQDMERVLKPKVDGSRYLNELFPENTLDFFVFFSSMTGVMGNMGQSNYTAANTFMCALARQRRERGLAASVINIGVIIGVGYVTREVSDAGQKNFSKNGYIWMSERDFHQIFAEAVLAGRPDSGCDPEISTGLRCINPNEPYQPIWYNNPVFAKFISQQEVGNTHGTKNSSGPPIKVRLQAATNETQISSILQDYFTSQLQTLLGGKSDDEKSKHAMLELRTDELGIDSLIAVEIRSWFLKNLNVNIPVLKILGGTLVKDWLQLAVKELPKDLVPSLVDNGQEPLPPEGPVTSLESVTPQLGVPDQDLTSSGSSFADQSPGTPSSSSRNESNPGSPISEPVPDFVAKSVVARPLLQNELAQGSQKVNT